ncbi:MAG: DinB family protein [Planctomycetota bacterium]
MHDIAPTLRILRATPGVIRNLLEGLTDDLLRANYGPDTFSPFDVLGHLILGERLDWVPRIRIIMEHGESREFDPFPWDGRDADTAQMTRGDRLDVFEDLRAANLDAVDAMQLTSADLERTGMHPIFGPVTMHQMISTWGVHDVHHTAQICKAVNYQFREAIGPWRPNVNSIPQ